MQLPKPEHGGFVDEVQGYIDGVLQPPGTQIFVEECEIFTDGSAVQARFRPMAHAACAAIQWDKEDKLRILKYQVPPEWPEWPQTAVCAEFLAVAKVAEHLAAHDLKDAVVITDCQAVQTLFYNSEMIRYRIKFVGHGKAPSLVASRKSRR